MASPCALDRQLARRRAARAALLATCCLAPWLGGCRAVDHAQVDVMERELRQQEDYIYELEDVVMTYSEKLRECRACQPSPVMSSGAAKRQASGEPTLADDRPRAQTPPRRASANRARPAPPVEEPAVEESVSPESDAAPAAQPLDPETLEAPELDIPPTSDLRWQNAAPIATTPVAPAAEGDEAPPYIPDPANYQIDVEPFAPIAAEPFVEDDSQSLAATDALSDSNVPAPTLPEPALAETTLPELTLAAPEVTEPDATAPVLPPESDPSRLVAERLQIRCVYAEPGNADAGKAPSLLAVVEALNATDEPVDADGEISLMVTAGESQDDLQRVDRWDFSAEESQAAWQSSPLGDGLHLALPLNTTALPAGPLALFARLVRPDGTKLLANVTFQADELTSLDAALAEPAPSDAPTAAGETDEQLAEAAPAAPADAIEPEFKPEPITHWRASSEPLAADRVVGIASTTDGAGGGWTRQAPGRLPSPATPRVAVAPGGKPRWQQGSASPDGDEGSWTPFR